MYYSQSNLMLTGLIGLFFLGCNNATGRPLDPGKPVVIRFSYDGDPITEGAVDLSGMGGGTTLTSTGEAVFEYVPFGTYQVVIHPKIEPASVIPPDAPPARSTSEKSTKIKIPQRFRDELTTPLQIKVHENGADRFEFDLKE